MKKIRTFTNQGLASTKMWFYYPIIRSISTVDNITWKKKNCTARETVKFNLRQLPWNKREGFQWRLPDAVERLTTAVNIASITIIYICCHPDTDLLRSDLFNTCSWFSAVCRFFNCAMFTRFRWLVQSKQRSTESCSKDRSVWKIDR